MTHNPPLRLIDSFKGQVFGNTVEAKVYRDVEWNEYRIKTWRNGVYQTEADAHTDERKDAIDTARHICDLPPSED